MQLHYPKVALHVPTLLLPRADIPLETWSVIACDQYTSQPEYWEEVRRIVGADPSTLHLVFPEAYLGLADRKQAIAGINQRMQAYLKSGVLVEQRPGFMLVEREVGRAAPRKGLVVALDLEQYDYRDGAQKLIRTTEGTDQSRLPPRIQVREKASLETPHIMVLIDDPQQTVIEPLGEENLKQAYDFELMLGGGRLRGWHIDDGTLIDEIAGRLGPPRVRRATADLRVGRWQSLLRHSARRLGAAQGGGGGRAPDNAPPGALRLGRTSQCPRRGVGVCANPSGGFWSRCGRSLAGNGDTLHRVGI